MRPCILRTMLRTTWLIRVAPNLLPQNHTQSASKISRMSAILAAFHKPKLALRGAR